MRHAAFPLALLLCVSAGLGACAQMGITSGAPPAPVAVSAPKPPPDPKTQMAALEERIAVLVVEQRLRLDPKAKPLAIDAELSKIARARAQDMADKNYLAHTAPDGQTSVTLLMAQDANYQGLLGENLAAQYYRPESGVEPEVFARRFLQTWTESKPHRDNLAFADYDRTGIGAAVNGDTVYVAQLFSTTLAPASKAGGVTTFESPQAAKDAAPAQKPAQPPLRLRGAQGTQSP